MTPGPHNPKTDFVGARRNRSADFAEARRVLWGKAKVVLVAAAVLGLALLCAFLYTSDKRTTRQTAELASPEQIEALRRRSIDKEAAFEKARQERFELNEDDLRLLQEALTAQEDYITARQSVGTEDARLTSLRRRLHLIRSERLRRESDEAEARALATVKADLPGAMKLLRRALECENEIANKWEAAGLADPGRRARLDTRLRRLESEALWTDGRALEAQGEQALKAGQFEQAASRFAEAIEKETLFTAQYRDVRDTEFGRADKLSVRRETALSGVAWRQVAAQRAAAEATEKAGDWPRAAVQWQQAVETFDRLLADFPRSQFADRAQEATMVTRQNFARMHAEIEAVRATAERMRGLLRDHEVEKSARLAAELLERSRRLAAANTGVFLPGDTEREELEFITAHEAVARALAANFDAQFRAVPGSKVRMFRTEISQGLYASLVGSNPSSVRRETNPVESVSYADAQEFCRRLGWLTGRTVRLPTVAEFTAAAGDLSRAPAADQAWLAGNSDGLGVRPVGSAAANPGGFHDLVGNVEEWAAAPDQLERAPAMGGSITTLAAAGMPNRMVLKREKSRTLGFRIVVE
jgi:formylglycine-generating enzyme required for sulfatase activity